MKISDLIRELQIFVVKYPEAANFPVVSYDLNHNTVLEIKRAVLDRRTGENKLILE